MRVKPVVVVLENIIVMLNTKIKGILKGGIFLNAINYGYELCLQI